MDLLFKVLKVQPLAKSWKPPSLAQPYQETKSSSRSHTRACVVLVPICGTKIWPSVTKELGSLGLDIKELQLQDLMSQPASSLFTLGVIAWVEGLSPIPVAPVLLAAKVASVGDRVTMAQLCIVTDISIR